MSSLPIIITTAGRAAHVNATNTGTLPLLIAQVGITAAVFVPGKALTALPGEIKRLSTFGGGAVAPDTIHVTIRDDGSDVYSLRGIGLYLADGTLYGVYGQPGVILEKSAQAMLLLAMDVIFADVDAATLLFGDANFLNPPATTVVQGVTQYATNAEALTGAANNRGIVASALKYVLDQRFGVGAPSTFVKGLLALATSASIRLALELKGAALKDEGVDNGLDADLLDGQHGTYYRAWGSLTDVPVAFPPAAHTHSFGSLTTPPATATRWPMWEEVSGKPATFLPTGHSHDWADINLKPAQATRWPAWSEVSNKPSAFWPLEHQHAASDITIGVFDVARIPDVPIAKVTSLSAALNSKAPKSSPMFDGNVGIGLPSGVAAGPLDVESGMGRVIVRSSDRNRPGILSSTSDGLVLAPFNIEASIFTHNGYGIWDTGNFNPGGKVDINSPNAGSIRLEGATSAYYCKDRNTGRDWAWYSNNDYLIFHNGFNDVVKITPNGSIIASNFAQESSLRYKANILTIDPAEALRILVSVRFCSYEIKATGIQQAGAIAEELAGGPLDHVVVRDESGRPDAVNYQPLFVMACAALQGLATRVAALESGR